MTSLIKNILYVLFLVSITNCKSTFMIENVDYASYLESVIKPDKDGFVVDLKNNIRFSIHSLVEREFGLNDPTIINEIRLIRNTRGYYFITAHKFKHVYVFLPESGKLKLKNRIEVSSSGIEYPFLNWREPYVELVSDTMKLIFYLNERGIFEKNKERNS